MRVYVYKVVNSLPPVEESPNLPGVLMGTIWQKPFNLLLNALSLCQLSMGAGGGGGGAKWRNRGGSSVGSKICLFFQAAKVAHTEKLFGKKKASHSRPQKGLMLCWPGEKI